MPIYTLVDAASQPFHETPHIDLPRHSSIWQERSTTLLPEVLAVVWGCGVVTVLQVWCGRWRQVSATLGRASLGEQGREVEILRRLESDAQMRKAISVVRSDGMMEPGISGFARLQCLFEPG